MGNMVQLISHRKEIAAGAVATLLFILLLGGRPSAENTAAARQGAAPGVVEPLTAAGERPTDQIIVKLVDNELSHVQKAGQMDRLSRAAGVQFERG